MTSNNSNSNINNNSIWSKTIPPLSEVRSSHSSVLLKNNTIAIFGGYDNSNFIVGDLTFYSIELQSWILPKVLSKRQSQPAVKPTNRVGHTCTLLNDGYSFIVFGGVNNSGYLSDTYLYDNGNGSNQGEWKEIKLPNTPIARSNHTSILVGNRVYIFGGMNDKGVLNTINVLNLDTLKWTIPICNGDTPPFIWGHTCTLHNNKLYFYGGCNNGINNYNNTLSILDLSNHTWKVNIVTTSIGPAPSSRLGHSFIKYNDVFVLLGGSNEIPIVSTTSVSAIGQPPPSISSEPKILNDCFIFSPDTLVWKHFSSENPPFQRSFHTVNNVGGLIYMYGGTGCYGRGFNDICILDIEKVLIKLESQPKKRIRLRPVKKSSIDNSSGGGNGNGNNNIMARPLSPLSPSSIPLPSLSPPSLSLLSPSTASITSTASILNIIPKPLSFSSPSSSSASSPPSSSSSASSSLWSSPILNIINSNKQQQAQAQQQTQLLQKQQKQQQQVQKEKLDEENKFKTIIEWINENGLQKYKDNFIMNDITFDNLTSLTEKHLIEDLLIPTLGARLKILNCIKPLCNNNNNNTISSSKSNNNNNGLLSEEEDRLKAERKSLQDSITNLKLITDTLSTTLLSLTFALQNLNNNH